MNDIAVVVRASGERTTSVCIQLLEEQVGKIAGLVEGVSPFNVASRKSVELAVATGKKYTALVDADVLVSPNSLAKLQSILERASPETFLVNTYTLDKFHLAGREGKSVKALKNLHHQAAQNFRFKAGTFGRHHLPQIAHLKNIVNFWGAAKQHASRICFCQ